MNIEVNLKVVAYPSESAKIPPSNGPNKDPVILPVCNVPSTRPATSLGVCVEMKAWDIETKPEKKPMKKRRINNCHTESTNPIKKMDNPIPIPE